MKLGQVVNATQALIALSNTKLPVKVAYRVGKAINLADIEIGHYGKQHDSIIKRLGKPLEDGNYQIDPAMPEFGDYLKERADLLDSEITLPGLHTIRLGELGNIEIEPSHLAQLDGWFLFDDEEVTA